MADTTKLAGTFDAWRLTIGFEPQNLRAAFERCEELGLQPKVVGHQIVKCLNRFRVRLLVTVPCCAALDADDFVNEHMGPFEGLLTHGTVVSLLCPPLPQPALALPSPAA